MPVFHLKPIVAQLEDPAWQTSNFRQECWVNARDEAEARGLASGKFQNGEATVSGVSAHQSPWRDPRLVEARPSHPPPGMTIPVNVVVAS